MLCSRSARVLSASARAYKQVTRAKSDLSRSRRCAPPRKACDGRQGGECLAWGIALHRASHLRHLDVREKTSAVRSGDARKMKLFIRHGVFSCTAASSRALKVSAGTAVIVAYKRQTSTDIAVSPNSLLLCDGRRVMCGGIRLALI